MTIYPTKDGKLEFDNKDSHKNVKSQPKTEEKMNEPSNPGEMPINGENLEAKVLPEPVKIVTSLSNVDPKAIQKFADHVGSSFNIPSNLRPFAAYFCGVRHSTTSNEVFPNGGMLQLRLLNQMRGRDFLEALRVVMDNPTENDIKYLTGKTLSQYDSEDLVNINGQLFSEYGLLQKTLGDCTIKRADQLVELLKVPQRARTFYAGAITSTYKLTEPNMYASLNSPRISLNSTSIKVPVLDISSQQIAQYAAKVKIEDYTLYVKLIGEL